MKKWKNAVIHLECASDSIHVYDRIEKMSKLRDKLEAGEITQEEFSERVSEGNRDLRYHGTAIFLEKDSKRYLLTARHVLWDKFSAKRELEEEIQRAKDFQEDGESILIESAKKRAENRIFSIIFRVPSYDEVIKKGENERSEFLMNLGAGTSHSASFTFSDPSLDLAIISLDQRNHRFADELEESGYTPIKIDDITNSPSKEGADVFTVGFPSATALLGQLNQHKAVQNWSSDYFSLPNLAFGRVSMLNKNLPFFWTDMSIYPGNSGGPVIEDDKLVGIVSAQPTISIENSDQLRTRIPFGKIIKASYIYDLIEQQEQKSQNYS